MDSWVRKFPWRRDRLPTPVFLGFPGGSDGKGSTCSAGDLDSIPGLGRFPGGGHGNPLQYSCLENRHGQRSLVGYSPWGGKEWDTTEQVSTAVQMDSLPSEPPGKAKNTRVSGLSLLQGNFLTQDSTQSLLHCRWILYQLNYQGSPHKYGRKFKK